MLQIKGDNAGLNRFIIFDGQGDYCQIRFIKNDKGGAIVCEFELQL